MTTTFRRSLLGASCATAILSADALAQSVTRTQAGAPTWELVENLRIGGDDDGPKSFTSIHDVVATKNGNIFVLETKVQEIRVFDSKGSFIRLAARKGKGPAEITRANGLAVGNDDVVWAHDPANARNTLFRADGTLLKDFPVQVRSYGFRWEAAIDPQGRALDEILVPGTHVDPVLKRPASDPYIRRIRPDGTIADTVAYPTCSSLSATAPTYIRFERPGGVESMNMGIPFLATPISTLTRAGTVWCTPADTYKLLVAPVGGGELREVVRLDVAPVPVPAAERQKFLKTIDSIGRQYGRTIGDVSLLPKTQPVIAGIHTDDRGRAWVVRTTGADSITAIDVFDATGRAAGIIRTRAKLGGVVFIAGSSLYTVLVDQDDVPSLVRYAIVERR